MRESVSFFDRVKDGETPLPSDNRTKSEIAKDVDKQIWQSRIPPFGFLFVLVFRTALVSILVGIILGIPAAIIVSLMK